MYTIILVPINKRFLHTLNSPLEYFEGVGRRRRTTHFFACSLYSSPPHTHSLSPCDVCVFLEFSFIIIIISKQNNNHSTIFDCKCHVYIVSFFFFGSSNLNFFSFS